MNPPHGLWVMIARRRHITSSTCNDPRCSLNPLLIGEAAPPIEREELQRLHHRIVSIPFSSGRRRRPVRNRIWKLERELFQSPSHRGGGAAHRPLASGSLCELEVSIPFSSGRRRRHNALMALLFVYVVCFNPLLIGEAAPPTSKNRYHRRLARTVSIPFSSGRRRRRSHLPRSVVNGRKKFQSPSHRGGGAALAVGV